MASLSSLIDDFKHDLILERLQPDLLYTEYITIRERRAMMWYIEGPEKESSLTQGRLLT